jgi:hypothetical protein
LFKQGIKMKTEAMVVVLMSLAGCGGGNAPAADAHPDHLVMAPALPVVAVPAVPASN